jgi:hypothetical protein
VTPLEGFAVVSGVERGYRGGAEAGGVDTDLTGAVETAVVI